MMQPIRQTRSLCPVCLKNLPALLLRDEDGAVSLERECPEHGVFRVPIWRGTVDFEQWTAYSEALGAGSARCCPDDCGICAEHESDTCCVVLEVTGRCNLRCRFCFADSGADAAREPDTGELKAAIRDIVQRCGQPLLQLSGGEPTLRDDLPELIEYAKAAGCSYVQLNTNGLRLAREAGYAETLVRAGLDIVFLQFDGTREEIYQTLRGAPLLQTKLEAIRVCARLGVGVTLVPTVVRGVNDDDLGALVELACSLVPGVRGIHFQPVSYFGRRPGRPEEAERYTLDQLITDLCDQTGIPAESFVPSRCDHPLCGFHGDFLAEAGGKLRPLSSISRTPRGRGCARDSREYVASHWCRPAEEKKSEENLSDAMDFDTFLYRLRHNRLTLSSMAFQDAGNINLERLHRCSLHVYDKGRLKPLCAHYLTPEKG